MEVICIVNGGYNPTNNWGGTTLYLCMGFSGKSGRPDVFFAGTLRNTVRFWRARFSDKSAWMNSEVSINGGTPKWMVYNETY